MEQLPKTWCSVFDWNSYTFVRTWLNVDSLHWPQKHFTQKMDYSLIKTLCLNSSVPEHGAELNVVLHRWETDSQLDGPSRESSPWWPEHHSAGWPPPYICSDPWQTEVNTQQYRNTDRETHKHTKKQNKTNKRCSRFHSQVGWQQVCHSIRYLWK